MILAGLFITRCLMKTPISQHTYPLLLYSWLVFCHGGYLLNNSLNSQALLFALTLLLAAQFIHCHICLIKCRLLFRKIIIGISGFYCLYSYLLML
jgi:hypothetical protein